nr:MAG TPA: hypothetical protein [Bacteriophage sp.]
MTSYCLLNRWLRKRAGGGSSKSAGGRTGMWREKTLPIYQDRPPPDHAGR